MTEAGPIRWMSTKDAADYLGVTLRSLYRFIDEGSLAAYKFGRVIRLKAQDVDRFIESCRIEPGSLEHLYPPSEPGGHDTGRATGRGARRPISASEGGYGDA